jgi:hypothetical protein
MSELSLPPIRQRILAILAAVCALSLVFSTRSHARGGARADAEVTPAEDAAIRPFEVNIPHAALSDLRRRVRTTRWPDKEVHALVQYRGTGYDWRKVEARLNGLPQFVTKIDGRSVHSPTPRRTAEAPRTRSMSS